jgi:hypothetical protein
MATPSDGELPPGLLPTGMDMGKEEEEEEE